MKAITKVLAGGVAIAAMASAAPASAQYYPGYGYGGGDVLGQVIGSVLGGGYGYGAPPVNSQAVVNQCANAVQARLSGGAGYGTGYGYAGGYGGYAPAYGYASPYGPAARVLGISRVEQRSGGGLTVRGVATTNAQAGYGYGHAGQHRVDLTWRCRTDFRGLITSVNIERAQPAHGYQQQQLPTYTPWGTDYSQYGYRRY
ncbi:MAG TPA: hypothetical protein VM308_02575 [Sphingomicrobium sp.]|nr:hypothetical protein [Sphingomicrobium sp.]